MSNNNEYIEDYFRGVLSEDEKKHFEERCVQDEIFAKAVALYISTEEGIRQHLLDKKRQEWRGAPEREMNAIPAPAPRISIRKWIAYAAAACTIATIILVPTFLRSPTPNQLADQYIKQHLTTLSHKMTTSEDVLEQGIKAYNNKEYDTALQLFEKAYQSNPADLKAKKHIGFVCLVTKQYDKALQQFRELANTPGSYDKSGLFWMAITLLERNKAGDEGRAKELLQQVVQQKTEGSKEAAEWLRVWE